MYNVPGETDEVTFKSSIKRQLMSWNHKMIYNCN